MSKLGLGIPAAADDRMTGEPEKIPPDYAGVIRDVVQQRDDAVLDRDNAWAEMQSLADSYGAGTGTPLQRVRNGLTAAADYANRLKAVYAQALSVVCAFPGEYPLLQGAVKAAMPYPTSGSQEPQRVSTAAVLYLPGDILRYGVGLTALFRVDTIYPGYGGSIARYYGEHILGGTHGAHHESCRPVSAADLAMWNSKRGG